MKGKRVNPSILVLLFILLFIFACSTPPWFPIKKAPPHKAKMKELLDKEVVIIDKKEYIKVLNPKFIEAESQPKYLYIPVEEYLSNREAYIIPSYQKMEAKSEPSSPTVRPPLTETEKEIYWVSSSSQKSPDLKRKVLLVHFDDRTTTSEEMLGDWIAEKLIKEISRRSLKILFIDYPMVKEFLQGKGIPLTDIETPKTLHLLNEVFGVHALILGQLSGPYIFTAKSSKDEERTASAILKIDLRVVETFGGKTIKTLSSNNPIIATKEKGTFSEEKAKGRAIDLTIGELARLLTRELEGLDWFCRIAKVEGEEVFINAGRLSGLKIGDLMEVYAPGSSFGKGEAKGTIQISSCFGIDASIGKLINGKKPDVDDIVRIGKAKGT